MILEIILLVYLAIISLIDLKYHTVPSVLTTAMILVLGILNPSNLIFGVLGVVFAVLMLESDFFRGLADLKMTAILGLMASSVLQFILLMILILVFGFVYKVLMVKVLKKKAEDEAPFIPVFLAVYTVFFIINIISNGL